MKTTTFIKSMHPRAMHSRMSRTLKCLALMLVLLLGGTSQAFAVKKDYIATAKYVNVKVKMVDGVAYNLYDIKAVYQYEGADYEVSTPWKRARIKEMAGVTTAKCVIPAKIYDGDVEYIVDGISQNYATTSPNNTITTLKFERLSDWMWGPFGGFYDPAAYDEPVAVHGLWDWFSDTHEIYLKRETGYNGGWSYSEYFITGEDRGLNFDKLNLPQLKKLYLPSLKSYDYKSSEWSFSGYTNLTDVYFIHTPIPELYEGMFTRASQITAHYYDFGSFWGLYTSSAIEELRNAAVWCNFKDIVPYYTSYKATIENNGSGEVEVYSCGELSYSEAVAQGKATLHSTCYGNSSGNRDFYTGENYYVTFHYDPNACNAPTVMRNGVAIALQEVEAGVLGYEETDVNGEITYVVSADDYKSCRLSFTRSLVSGSGSGNANNLAGTYKIVRNGQTLTGNITDSFVDCDRGSQVTLTFPAIYQLVSTSLYNHETQQSTPFQPTETDGLYTFTFDVPLNGSVNFRYSWNIPAEKTPDPVIQVMRMGEGEVKLTGFWEWNRDHDEYYNRKMVNCVMQYTEMTIPKPTYETDAWGFKLEMKPQKGQIVRNLLVGYIMDLDNGEGQTIDWMRGNAAYDASTGTYTFLVDLYHGDGSMDFEKKDYLLLVDMGPEQTIVEEGCKQQIFCKGTTESQVWYSAEETQYLSTNGSTKIVMDSDDGYDHFIGIRLAEGEKFTVYRDGVDVTNRFPSYQSNFLFEFDSEDFYTSSWTILFEKEEKNEFTWTIIQTGNDADAELMTTRSQETETIALTKPVTTQTIAPQNLTRATLRVPTGEATEYAVFLVSIGNVKIDVIKAVKDITGLGLKEAKDLVESADGITPVLIKTFATAAEAQAAKEALETAGATVLTANNGSGLTTRVFRDGEDVTAQGTAESGFLCYEVSASNLTNTTWVIVAEETPNPFDVNGDGVINPQDALKVIEKYMDQ